MIAQPRKNKGRDIIVTILLAILGFAALTILLAVLGFVPGQRPAPPPTLPTAASSPAPSTPPPAASPSSALPRDGTCANDPDGIEYLIFWEPLPPGLGGIDNFTAKLGTTGDGKTRQLGLGAGIPFFVRDESNIASAIKQGFDIAKRTNVAVHFNVDDHIKWDERPDLWNWYDPTKKGYNPDNRKNVEWYDWEGTSNKRRYLTPEGAPSQSPHMCYNSREIAKEVTRIISQVIGPALRKEIDKLKQKGQQYLFAGITVGSEAGFDDYSKIPRSSQIPPSTEPMQVQSRELLLRAATMIEEDKAPHGGLGYCSLTNAGYSKTNPPADFNQALADVNKKFIEFWDKQFVDAGIPCSKIYTHVAAPTSQDDSDNAPRRIAFNPYARPGWSTYPVGTLENGFQPLYDEIARHGNLPWGGVEANATPNAAVSWEEYLAWHYNHGAKLVGINVGASDQTLMAQLTRGAFGDKAMAAYKKFLDGKPLIGK